jgi:hypothetical protein
MPQAYEFVQPSFFLGLITMPEFDDPLLASRMAEFKTNDASPSLEHRIWLRGAVADLVRRTPNCWVRLIGHASMRGNAVYNVNLSARRIAEVEAILKGSVGNADIYKEQARGSRDSGTDARDDSGQYRAVELMVFAPSTPRPHGNPDQPQPVVTPKLEVQFSKSTLTKVLRYKDFEPPEPGDKWNKLGKLVFEAGKDAVVLKRHLEKHPYERDAPDFGAVTARSNKRIDAGLVMKSIDIMTEYSETNEFFKVGYEMKNTYTYDYGPGSRSDKVVVRRRFKSGETAAPFFIDNPSDYLDP